MVTPSSSAIGARTVGTCSETLLNSSPANLPEPRACANCLNAFDDSCADDPANLAAVLNPKNTVLISSTDVPSGANLAVISVTP